ncbi:MAG TPA: response regulator transcription factor [Actinomycetota bacterium]|nr:response regulator transcription factor [Actinomycetota bacterium]
MGRIRVLIADDHPVVRHGLRAFLQLQEDLDIVGEAGDGVEAVARVKELRPDVVLLDLVMPNLDGIDAIRQIRQVSSSTKIIVLTTFADDEKVFPAVRAGAAGYLLKDVEPRELVEAIRTVNRGQGLLHPSIASKLMHEFAGGHERADALEALTDREMDVLRLIAQGKSNREIAREFVLSEKTVKTHVSNILAKLRLADRTQAALYAVRNRLVD